MASIIDVQIPLANGGHIQVTKDSASGGFMLLNILKADATQDSSTPLTLTQSQQMLNALQGATVALRAIVAAGL